MPYLWLSAVYIDVWRDPMAWGDGQWVHHGVVLMVAEFFLLHSGVFLGGAAAGAQTTKGRWRGIGGVVLFYLLFVGAFALINEDPSIIRIYGIAICGRLITIAIAANDPGIHLAERSLVGAVLYVALVPASIFLPLPELGVDHRVAKLAFPDAGDGVWTREPHRGLAIGAAYFALMGLAEIFWYGRARRGTGDTSSAGTGDG